MTSRGLARHTSAIAESLSKQITVIDKKYADLPPRVTRIETKVFTPRRRRPPGSRS
jgi:hypothetical protein